MRTFWKVKSVRWWIILKMFRISSLPFLYQVIQLMLDIGTWASLEERGQVNKILNLLFPVNLMNPISYEAYSQSVSLSDRTRPRNCPLSYLRRSSGPKELSASVLHTSYVTWLTDNELLLAIMQLHLISSFSSRVFLASLPTGQHISPILFQLSSQPEHLISLFLAC